MTLSIPQTSAASLAAPTGAHCGPCRSLGLCCWCAQRPAIIPLADESGHFPPAAAGGFCYECVPAQTPDDPGQDAEYAYRARFTPASLELVTTLAIPLPGKTAAVIELERELKTITFQLARLESAIADNEWYGNASDTMRVMEELSDRAQEIREALYAFSLLP